MAQSPYKDHTMLHWNSQSPVESDYGVNYCTRSSKLGKILADVIKETKMESFFIEKENMSFIRNIKVVS